jgi:hypothetical protein
MEELSNGYAANYVGIITQFFCSEDEFSIFFRGFRVVYGFENRCAWPDTSEAFFANRFTLITA